jgi:perosamine synthetase
LFQRKIAFGSQGYPWTGGAYKGDVNYNIGLCPVVEKMHFEEVITHELMRPGMQKNDLDDVVEAFLKVWKNINELK